MQGCGLACVYAEVFLLILGLALCEPTKFAGPFYFLGGCSLVAGCFLWVGGCEP